MRNLTIKRGKSFVGCAVKDKVYIEDPMAPELTIEGVPCRKLGDIKNGKTATFQIDEGAHRIFVIADKLSKEYCNASVVVPAGQEDMFYSGKHKFLLGSNPFCFDGVPLTPEQTAAQKKKGRKGAIVFICALIIGAVVGTLIATALFGDPAKADPKTFEKEDLKITLTEKFKEQENEDAWVSYGAKTIVVNVTRDDYEEQSEELGFNIERLSLEEYAELVQEVNNLEDEEIKEGDGYLYIEYNNTEDGQEQFCMGAMYKGENAFWCVNFVTPEENEDKYKDVFHEWAESVEVE